MGALKEIFVDAIDEDGLHADILLRADEADDNGDGTPNNPDLVVLFNRAFAERTAPSRQFELPAASGSENRP